MLLAFLDAAAPPAGSDPSGSRASRSKPFSFRSLVRFLERNVSAPRSVAPCRALSGAPANRGGIMPPPPDPCKTFLDFFARFFGGSPRAPGTGYVGPYRASQHCPISLFRESQGRPPAEAGPPSPPAGNRRNLHIPRKRRNPGIKKAADSPSRPSEGFPFPARGLQYSRTREAFSGDPDRPLRDSRCPRGEAAHPCIKVLV